MFEKWISQTIKNVEKNEVDLLLAFLLKKDKTFFIAHPDYQLTLLQKIHFIFLLSQRKSGYSIASIVKKKYFYGKEFFVNKNVLIPRAETEILIEEVLHEIKLRKAKSIGIIDIGTGSGCIPITLSIESPKPVTVYASDISRKALKVAKKNAEKYNTKIAFHKGNLFEPFMKKNIFFHDFIIITANLPYITELQFKEEKSIQKEPKIALVAKDEGLYYYKKLLPQVQHYFSHSQFSLSMFLEIDPTQTAGIKEFIKDVFPFSTVQIKKDLSGLDRIVQIHIEGKKKLPSAPDRL